MIKFEVMTENEDGWCDWIHPEPGYLLQCCNCGLVHEMEFAVVPRGEVEGRFPLNEGESEAGVIVFRASRLIQTDGEDSDTLQEEQS